MNIENALKKTASEETPSKSLVTVSRPATENPVNPGPPAIPDILPILPVRNTSSFRERSCP
ncbi:MAG: hypothetical protein WDN28_01185 [Chthoniobacter sp.]